MKLKIIFFYFIFITVSNAENNYIFFGENDIFLYKQDNKETIFYKLQNRSELLNKKFDISTKLIEKKNVVENNLIVQAQELYNLNKDKKNFIQKIDFLEEENLQIYNNDELVINFDFPQISKDSNLLFRLNKKIKERSLINLIKSYYEKDSLFYSIEKKRDNLKKIKIKNLKIPLNIKDKNLILIDSNLNISSFIVKFSNDAVQHLSWFDKALYKNQSKQYFLIPKKANEINQFQILVEKANNDFYISEVQIFYGNNKNVDHNFADINFYLTSGKNLENFEFLNPKENYYLLNILKVFDNKKNTNLNNISIKSKKNLNLISEYTTINFLSNQETKLKNVTVHEFLKKKNKEYINYSILVEKKDLNKLFFILISLSPFFLLILVYFFINLQLNLNYKTYITLKNLFYIFSLLFIISLLGSIYFIKIKFLNSLSFIFLIIIFIIYAFLKKNYNTSKKFL